MLADFGIPRGGGEDITYVVPEYTRPRHRPLLNLQLAAEKAPWGGVLNKGAKTSLSQKKKIK